MALDCLQNFHPFFLGNDYIGPAVDHFQEITARFPQVIMVLEPRECTWLHGMKSEARKVVFVGLFVPVERY